MVSMERYPLRLTCCCHTISEATEEEEVLHTVIEILVERIVDRVVVTGCFDHRL